MEVWLNKLLDVMKETVLHELGEAQTGYEEKPREQCISEFPAQVCLVFTINSLTLEPCIV